MIIQFLAAPIALRHSLDSSGKDIDGLLAEAVFIVDPYPLD